MLTNVSSENATTKKDGRGRQVYGLRHSNIGMQRDHLTGITGLVTSALTCKSVENCGHGQVTQVSLLPGS